MYRNRVFRTVVLPLLVALLATAALYLVTSSGANQGPQPTVQTDYVVVAMRPISPRTVVTGDMVALQEVPVAYIVPGAIRSLDACVGRITVVPLAAGEILMNSNVTSEMPAAAGLSYAITPGKRAMTIQVDEISGVAGFPEVGDRIDVFVTMTGEDSEQRTRLVVEDLAILAVGQESAADPTSGTRELRGYTSLTLEVSPEEAATIAIAENNGRLRLALRSVLDGAHVGVFEITRPAFIRTVADLSFRHDHRIGFAVRVAEVDPAVLADLGYSDLSGSAVPISGWQAGRIESAILAGRGRFLSQVELSTGNRVSTSYKLTGGAFATDAPPGTAATPYGLTVSLRPAYYGQGFVNLDLLVQMQTADVPDNGRAPSGRSTALSSFHRVPSGDAVLVLGLIAADDMRAPREGVTRYVLPGGPVSETLTSGTRVLIVMITPSA